MPEGPEVRRAADWLSRFIGGTILDVTGSGVQGKLQHPCEILAARSHGKLLWLECANIRVVIKLQLKGSLGTRRRKPVGVVRLAEPHPEIVLNDPLGVAWIRVDEDPAKLRENLDELGPDPYHQEITPEDLGVLARPTRRRSIAAALLDQSLVAGIGNYLRSEIIFAAGLTPAEWRESYLTPEKLRALARAINQVFAEAYSSEYTMKCYRTKGASVSMEGSRKFYYCE